MAVAVRAARAAKAVEAVSPIAVGDVLPGPKNHTI